MQLEIWEWYLIIINVIGFLTYFINMRICRRTGKGKMDGFLKCVAVFGGSLGMLTVILLFDRKAQKNNMVLRVYSICTLVIWGVLLLLVKGHRTRRLSFDLIGFFGVHRWLFIYLLAVNVITFLVFAVDKLKAIRKKSRIRIVTLLGLAMIGGSVGGLLSMFLFHHKTKKDYFTEGLPLMLLMQFAVIFCFMNLK